MTTPPTAGTAPGDAPPPTPPASSDPKPAPTLGGKIRALGERPLLVSGIVVGIYAVVLLIVWFSNVGSENCRHQWHAIEGAATAIGGLLALGAVVYTAIQVREIREARHVEILGRLSETYASESEITARRFILQNFPENPDDPGAVLQAMSPEDKGKAKQVLNTLEHTWMVLDENDMSKERLSGWLSPMVIKTYRRLKPYVDHTRAMRGEDDFYEDAERIYNRCVEWRVKQFGHSEMPVHPNPEAML